jgi:hypothetical protein
MQGIQSQPALRGLGLLPGARRRAWSILLVLAIAVASFMHVAHSHAADAPSIYKQHCTFCSTFDRGGAPPPATQAVLAAQLAPILVVAPLNESRATVEQRSTCRPRAPPLLQA